VWDAQTGGQQFAIAHAGPVNSVCFSPDGKLLASASDDKAVRLWDAQTGREQFSLKGMTDWVRSVCFSPDGKLLAGASDDKTVRLWAVPVGPQAEPAVGTLTIEVNEPNPDLYVDGEKVTVTWADGGKRAEVRVRPGKHKVEVKKDGFVARGGEVTLSDGSREVFTARLDKLPSSRPASVVHCVIFRMKKDAPADAAEQVIADCHKMLAKIRSVRSVRAGRPARTGTDEKLKKPFDVGLLVLCDDVAGLKAYIDDPLHKEFAAKYGKYFDIEQLQVFDFVDWVEKVEDSTGRRGAR
jgi:hypothetical protein